MGRAVRGLVDHHVDLARQQILQGRGGAAIGHELDGRAAHLLEVERRGVRDRAVAATAVRHLAGIGPDQGQELSEEFATSNDFLTRISCEVVANIATGAKSRKRSNETCCTAPSVMCEPWLPEMMV